MLADHAIDQQATCVSPSRYRFLAQLPGKHGAGQGLPLVRFPRAGLGRRIGRYLRRESGHPMRPTQAAARQWRAPPAGLRAIAIVRPGKLAWRDSQPWDFPGALVKYEQGGISRCVPAHPPAAVVACTVRQCGIRAGRTASSRQEAVTRRATEEAGGQAPPALLRFCRSASTGSRGSRHAACGDRPHRPR